MKNKFTVIILTVLLLSLSLCCVVNAADEEDEVDRIFDAVRMMQFDEGTAFENGIVNGAVINPATGRYSTYTGIKFDLVTYKAETAVKVELLDGYTNGYFDFNYYQYNSVVEKAVLNASTYKYLKIRYAYPTEISNNVRAFKIWVSKWGLGSEDENRTSLSQRMPMSKGEWKEIVINLDDLEFQGDYGWYPSFIRQFRIHLFENNTDPKAVCYIAGFGFFETMEEAESYVFDTACISGDFDGDGAVTPTDAVRFSRYLADWGEGNDIDKSRFAFDVNSDKIVNSLDVVYLYRHLAGWNGYKRVPFINVEINSSDGSDDNDDTTVGGVQLNFDGILVIKDVTGYNVGDSVTVKAMLNGSEKSIKIEKLATEIGDGYYKLTELDEMDSGKLRTEADKLFGVYHYIADPDGYYTVLESVTYNVADFIDGTSIDFQDGSCTNFKNTGLPDGVQSRNLIIRVNQSTSIYRIDRTAQTVVSVPYNPVKGKFSLEVDADTEFYADKIGFGSNDYKDDDITWEHGTAGILCIIE